MLDKSLLLWYNVDMQILCELKRFSEKVTRGRFTGQMTEYAISIGGDNYSWNICRVNLNANGVPNGQMYFKGFCHLLQRLSEFDIDPKDAIGKITAALEKNTKVKLTDELSELIKESDDLNKIGEAIDDVYKCNYNKVAHDSGKTTDKDRVYIRVLKAKVGQKD
jgi:hypothetical protein